MRGEVGIFEIGKDHAKNLTIHLKHPPSPATTPYNYRSILLQILAGGVLKGAVGSTVLV
jgi:hypothetical protein